LYLQFKNRAKFWNGRCWQSATSPETGLPLSLNATDIFNSRKRAFLSSSDEVSLNFERHVVSSRVTLIFSYRLARVPVLQNQPNKKSGSKTLLNNLALCTLLDCADEVSAIAPK